MTCLLLAFDQPRQTVTDKFHGIWRLQSCRAHPICSLSIRGHLVLILNVNGAGLKLDVANALRFLKAQQGELTVKAIMDGYRHRHDLQNYVVASGKIEQVL